MDVKTGIAAICLSLSALSTPAWAQTTPTPSAGSRQTIPEKNATTDDKLKAHEAPSTTMQDGRSDSLSTKLNKSGGVIAPKGDIDPGMKSPTPVGPATSTPVIPPSATGGDNAK